MSRGRLESHLVRIRADPEDEHAWTGLADALIALGDERGELINLERAFAHASANERRSLARARNRVLSRGIRTWLGPKFWRLFASYGEHGDRYDEELRRLRRGETTWSRTAWIPKLLDGKTQTIRLEFRGGFVLGLELDLDRVRHPRGAHSWESADADDRVRLAEELVAALEASSSACALRRIRISGRGREAVAEVVRDSSFGALLES